MGTDRVKIHVPVNLNTFNTKVDLSCNSSIKMVIPHSIFITRPFIKTLPCPSICQWFLNYLVCQTSAARKAAEV